MCWFIFYLARRATPENQYLRNAPFSPPGVFLGPYQITLGLSPSTPLRYPHIHHSPLREFRGPRASLPTHRLTWRRGTKSKSDGCRAVQTFPQQNPEPGEHPEHQTHRATSLNTKNLLFPVGRRKKRQINNYPKADTISKS